ncbi:EAL domain-containing response regulator [Marinobacter sp. 2_MG-2023]|uniref:GGDEF/EAL domain-containing response regulator n=1 Tax=Marinobacter sp. 2_MG-2023 TaxID=3062679 RepID=UPI0026E1BBB9|nr:EAL domain-containing response regulator [Marinobacter sp. 2_MG-2023]MDO6440944.1 EAL domain-containing protein [Marinobacter sp. 2_MG-2023]
MADEKFNFAKQRLGEVMESTIMLVDDEPVMLDIVQALLEESGYQHFVAVEHSTDAMSKMEASNPDIMLLDLDMPELDGFQVLEQVRNHKKFSHLPVIILTSAEDAASKLKALELGATDFLSKPVDPSELGLRVRNTLSAKAYRDQLAYYDSLTGLPNRNLFLDRLFWSMENAKRTGTQLVLLDIGLDRFRKIYETLGMSAGDSMLQDVALRLQKVIRTSDLISHGQGRGSQENVARISGEEFSVVLSGVSQLDRTSMICKRIIEEVEKPLEFKGREYYLSAGVGMSVYPDDGEDVESLVKYASAAREHAKVQGAGKYLFYSGEMNAQALTVINMEAELKNALKNNEFELVYQPKVDGSTGRTVGVESLIRWNHPQRGRVAPFEFISVAESTGLIVSIGNWVLKEACSQMSHLHGLGYDDLTVSVNVAALQFEDEGFKASIVSALDQSGLNPKSLILEITESTLMGDVDRIVDLMEEVIGLGVSFSVDDFGTGYSSLSYLKRFPISELKIDRSFLLGISTEDDDRSIVQAIITLAHSLNQRVVAEGVEEKIQLEFLQQNGCDVIQGYYFSKPLETRGLIDYLA